MSCIVVSHAHFMLNSVKDLNMGNKGPTLPKLPLPSTLWNTRWFMVRCTRVAVGVTGAGLEPPRPLPPDVNTNLQPWGEYIWTPKR